MLLCKHRFLSLRKSQALARFASQSRKSYFKTNLKHISGIEQMGWDLSSQDRQTRLINRRQAYAGVCLWPAQSKSKLFYPKKHFSTQPAETECRAATHSSHFRGQTAYAGNLFQSSQGHFAACQITNIY